MPPTLALCVICHDRPEELGHALGRAADFDEVVVIDMASTPPLEPLAGVTWLRSDTNLGVTEGRNLQATTATSDVVVFLDDDARFPDPGAAAKIRDAFTDHPESAVVAFLVERPDGSIVRSEQPFRGLVRDQTRARRCAYFLGGASAVRRAAYLDVGGFDERFLYSTEELDLAFALERAGWQLWYEPRVRVVHSPSPHGRGLSPQVPALRLRNRLWLARRHLPVPIAIVHSLAWGLRTFVESLRAGGLGRWRDAWRDGLRAPIDRRPLSYGRLWRMHRAGGHVFW